MGPVCLLVMLHHHPPPVLPGAPFDLAAILEIPREGMYHRRAQTCGVVKRNSWPGTETHTLTLISHTHTLQPSFVMLLLTSLTHSHQPVYTLAFMLSAIENYLSGVTITVFFINVLMFPAPKCDNFTRHHQRTWFIFFKAN